MKKLVVAFVSLLVIQAMVTVVLADTVPSLATYGPGDGWTIVYKGTSGNDSRAVGNYYFPDGIPASWNTLVSKSNEIGWVGPSDDDPKFWEDTISDSTTKATNIPRVPPGLYNYTIELGDFVEGETWILSGGFATDNLLLNAIVWSDSSVTSIDNQIHRNETELGIYSVALGEGIVLSDLLCPETTYFLTLTILNAQGQGPKGSSPQGLLSWLDLSKTSSSPAPTPEPATLLILGLGAVGAGFAARRRMSK